MTRQAIIDAALKRHNMGPQMRTRIERLLDGIEDRRRLHCCNSGCHVCVEDIQEVLAEVESEFGTH